MSVVQTQEVTIHRVFHDTTISTYPFPTYEAMVNKQRQVFFQLFLSIEILELERVQVDEEIDLERVRLFIVAGTINVVADFSFRVALTST